MQNKLAVISATKIIKKHFLITYSFRWLDESEGLRNAVTFWVVGNDKTRGTGTGQTCTYSAIQFVLQEALQNSQKYVKIGHFNLLYCLNLSTMHLKCIFSVFQVIFCVCFQTEF